MAFVTRMRLTSGDRETLDSVVANIKETAERKGMELTGPHSRPPIDLSVPRYRRSPPGAAREDAAVSAGDTFDTWRYTVYERELEIVGRDELVRRIAGRDFPDAVRVEVEVERRTGAGG